ncbi:flagellar hook-length control protein FliK [Yersinia nurmii]|uniref:Flagellar hook-length control protein FliK n=1 Tax=Yersinia nurmii TaxID=685706 RepID=A0AAW7K7H1_9GAMM|nr:flagellar hook-length control protein FliK [Yersinia nurmii]MDN0088799.1 flagellar hook-length control protein FliK [Yersinia nurmii]CNE35306.1 flagellar hook-length control protein FliK [Yersinia nurmii]
MNLSVLPGVATPTETEGTASSSIAALFSDAGLPADFADLLGGQLSQLAQKLDAADAKALKSSLAAVTGNIADVEGDKTSQGSSKLNQLLAALGDITATLPAGLTAAGQTGESHGKKVTPEDDQKLEIQTDKPDLNPLHTLLAMLPHQVATTLANGNGLKSGLTAQDNLNAGSKGSAAGKGEALGSVLGLTGQDKELSALLGTTLSNGKKEGGNAANDLLTEVKTKTEKVELRQNRPTGQTQDNSAMAANKTAALSALIAPTEAINSGDKALLTSAITPSLPPVSSPIMTAPTGGLASAPVAGHLTAQLGSQEWQQALGQQVLMFSRNGQQNAELRLHPQELGALQISLKIEDNQAQLHFASAHGQVRAALEAALPGLRHALAESGIQLGQSSVSSEGSSQWQQAQQQQHQQNQQNYAANGQPAYGETGESADSLTPLVTPAALQSLASGNGGVDIFA